MKGHCKMNGFKGYIKVKVPGVLKTKLVFKNPETTEELDDETMKQLFDMANETIQILKEELC